MLMQLKKNTLLIDKENESEWRLDCRTRGRDIDNGPGVKPTQTWVYVIFNREGHRRFIPASQLEQSFTVRS